MTEPPPSVAADAALASYERRLRRGGDSASVGDDDLRRILQRVGERRSRRSGATTRLTPAAPPGPGAPAEAPPQPGPAPTTGPAPQPDPAPTTGPAGTVLSVEDVGPGVRTFRLARPSGFTFVAGQHVKVGLPGTRRASFSIASAPYEPHLELCVELIAGGRLTPALFRLRPGDRVEVSAPKGRFTFDDRAARHVMVATSTGIAPLRSMLREARHRGSTAEVVVLHGASHPDELPYQDELSALAASDPALRYLPTVSRPTAPRSQGWSGLAGRVDEHALALLRTAEPGGTRVYACGNGGMVRRVRDELEAAGFAVSTETYD